HRCILRGSPPRAGIVPHAPAAVARFLAVLPPELERPQACAAVMRYVAPARFAKFDSRMHTLAELWKELLALLQAESDPEEMQGFFPPGLDASDVLRGARLLAKNRYLSWAHAPRANYSGRVTILGATNPQRLQG